MAVGRETISLAFLAAIQLLPPRQRAVLILRDVLSMSAGETAGMLDTTTQAANSALQRARSALRERWPGGRLEWAPANVPDEAQRDLVRRYIAAHEGADPEALIALLREDVRLTIEPGVGSWTGRDRVAPALREDMMSEGRWRMLPTGANRQPAVAAYICRPGDTTFRPFALILLRLAPDGLAAMDVFEAPGLFPAFGLPDRIAQRDSDAAAPRG
nr:hypothetical protein GCM10020063_024950 [Dactylosporangium thailandense]